MIELLISAHKEAAFFAVFCTLAGVAAIISGLWPRYGYTKYPDGRFRLRNSDYKDGPFGIWMKVSTFRTIVCLYGLLLIIGGIICYPIIASA